MELLTSITTVFENIFSSLGAGDGFFAPLLRAGIGALVGILIFEAIRPSIAYSGSSRRPWIVTNPNLEGATFFPWWSLGAILALFSSTFI